MVNYEVIVAMADFSPCYKRGAMMKGNPTGFVIHSTGAENPDLKRWVNEPVKCGKNRYENYFGGKNNPDVTPHAVYGLKSDGTPAVVQILPYTMIPYGCGQGKNGSYNIDHIQIEIAEDYGKKEPYFREMWDNVAEWVASLCNIYNIDVKNIVSHKEAAAAGYASNHGDPEHWFFKYGVTMNNFRAHVQEYINAKKDSVPAEDKPKINYTVQVGAFTSYENAKAYCDDLNNKGIQAFVKKV